MNWMIRFSNEGVAYNGFKWNQMGKWTEAPDWNPAPVCGGGLHGQNQAGHGYCQTGTRFEFCEIKDHVVVDNNKVKAKRARIVAVNDEAFQMLMAVTNGNFLGALDLRGYAHPLPAGFTHAGGALYLRGYAHPLPAGFTHAMN